VLSVVFNMCWGCVVCGVSMFDALWFLFGVVVLGGGFLASDFRCVCVCVCVCARARGLVHLVFLWESTIFLTNVKDVGWVNQYGVCLCL